MEGTDVSIERGPYVKSYDDLELLLAVATKRFGRLHGLDRCGECVVGRGTDQVAQFESRHNLVSGRSKDLNHDAVMRIGSEAPKRDAILCPYTEK